MTAIPDRTEIDGPHGAMEVYNPRWWRLDRALWWHLWARWTYDTASIDFSFRLDDAANLVAHHMYPAYRRKPTRDELTEELIDLHHRFACVVEAATGGRASKTNYTKEVYDGLIDDHATATGDEARAEIMADAVAYLRDEGHDALADEIENGDHNGYSHNENGDPG